MGPSIDLRIFMMICSLFFYAHLSQLQPRVLEFNSGGRDIGGEEATDRRCCRSHVMGDPLWRQQWRRNLTSYRCPW